MTSALIGRNKVSRVNSRAAATLSEGSTFTGQWEPCLEFASVAVTLTSSSTDSIGHLVIQFSDSVDGDVITSSTCLTVFKEHLYKSLGCVVKGPFYRIKFHAARVQDTRLTKIPNNFVGLTVTTQLRATSKHFDVNIASQLITMSGIQHFEGVNFSGLIRNVVANTMSYQTLAPGILLPTTNTSARVETSSIENREDGGSGAKTFLVWGVDQNGREVYWKGGFVIDTSAESVNCFTRINGFRVLTCGENRSPDTDSTMSIKLFDGQGYATMVTLDSQYNYVYDSCMYTVPAGFTATAVSWDVSAQSHSYSDTYLELVRNDTLQPINLALNVNNLATHQSVNSTVRALPGDTFLAEVSADAPQWVSVRACIKLESAPGDVTFSNYLGSSTLNLLPPVGGYSLFLDSRNVYDTGIDPEQFAQIGTWFDRSGNNNHYVQEIQEKRPRYVSSGVSGVPAIRFDAEDSTFLTPGDGPLFDFGKVVFIVCSPGSAGSDILSFSNNGGNLQAKTYDGYTWFGEDAQYPILSQANALSDGASVIAIQPQSDGPGSACNIWLNGSQIVNNDDAVGLIQNTSIASIGASADGLSRFFTGDIYCVLVYDSSSVTESIATISTYLQNRYNSGTLNYSSSGGGDPIFIPFNLSRFQTRSWYDASDAETITLDVNGYITSWADKSGRSNDVTQNSAPNRPVYLTSNGLNGLPAVQFSGNEWLDMDNPDIFVDTDFFMIFVLRGGDLETSYLMGGQTTDTNTDLHLIWVNNYIAFNYWGNGLASNSLPDPFTNSARNAIVSVSQSSIGRQIFYNGYEVGSDFNTIYLQGNSGFAFGRSVNGNFTGLFSEIIVLQQVPNVDERKQLEGYLAWKWAMQTSLANDHPYRNTGPTMHYYPEMPPVFGCSLFLDAGDVYGNGTAATTGDLMSIWADKSGNANHFTQSEDSNKPVYERVAISGRPALLFSGNKFLQPINAVTPGPRSTTFAAIFVNGPAASYVCGYNDFANTFQGIATNVLNFIDWIGDNSPAEVPQGISTQSNFPVCNSICVSRQDFGMNRKYVNTNLVSETFANTFMGASTVTNIGANPTGTGGFFVGQMYGICIFPTNLDQTCVLAMQEFFATRFKTSTGTGGNFTDPWSPSMISTRVWYDLSNSVSVTTDGFSGISEIADLSGRDHHATQTVQSQRPSLINIDSYPAAVFDGVDDFLDLDGSVFVNSEFFIIAALKQTAVGGSFCGGTSPDANSNLNIGWNSNTLYFCKDISDTFSTADANLGVNKIIAFSYSASYGRKIYVNGTQGSEDTNTTTYLTANPGFTIGKFYLQPHFTGAIREIIVLGQVPNSHERQIMEGYLAHKWAIVSVLPSGHPYESNPPLNSAPGRTLPVFGSSVYLDSYNVLGDNSIPNANAPVHTWSNRSGNSFFEGHFTRNVEIETPKYTNSSNNGSGPPAIQFHSSAYESLSGTFNNGYSNNNTLLVACTPSVSNGFVTSYDNSLGVVTGYGRSLGWNDVDALFTPYSAGGGQVVGITQTDGSVVNGYRNGFKIFNAVPLNALEDSNLTTVGCDAFGSLFYNGDLFSVVTYPCLLDDIDYARVSNFLRDKYGCSFGFQQPVNNAALIGCNLFLDSLDVDANSTAANNGDPVNGWIDKSGYENHTYHTSLDKPTYIAVGTNGLPCIRFSNSYLAFSVALPLSESNSFFIVCTPSSTSDAFITDLSGVNHGPAIISGFEGDFEYFGNNVTRAVFAPTGTASGINIVSYVRSDGGLEKGYFNGTLAFSQSSASNCAGVSFLGIGGLANNPTGAFFTGDILAVVLFPTALSDMRRSQVEAYLHTRYQTV